MEQYLIFKLYGQLYAIETTYVWEVAKEKELVQLPHFPKDMKGIMKLRNEVVPIVDSRVRWSRWQQEIKEDSTPAHHVIVMGDKAQKTGWLVDEVLSTVQWKKEDFLPLQGKMALWKNAFIKHAAMWKEKLVVILSNEAFNLEGEK